MTKLISDVLSIALLKSPYENRDPVTNGGADISQVLLCKTSTQPHYIVTILPEDIT